MERIFAKLLGSALCLYFCTVVRAGNLAGLGLRGVVYAGANISNEMWSESSLSLTVVGDVGFQIQYGFDDEHKIKKEMIHSSSWEHKIEIPFAHTSFARKQKSQ